QSRRFASIVSMSAHAQLSDHWILSCSSKRCRAGAIHRHIPKAAARCNCSTIERSCKPRRGRIGLVDMRDQRNRFGSMTEQNTRGEPAAEKTHLCEASVEIFD